MVDITTEVVGNLDSLILLLKTLSGIFLIYVFYLIANFFLIIKRNKSIKQIQEEVSLIRKRLMIKDIPHEERKISRFNDIFMFFSGTLFFFIFVICVSIFVYGWEFRIGQLAIGKWIVLIIGLIAGAMSFLYFKNKK